MLSKFETDVIMMLLTPNYLALWFLNSMLFAISLKVNEEFTYTLLFKLLLRIDGKEKRQNKPFKRYAV